jgi:hypothetical protein
LFEDIPCRVQEKGAIFHNFFVSSRLLFYLHAFHEADIQIFMKFENLFPSAEKETQVEARQNTATL